MAEYFKELKMGYWVICLGKLQSRALGNRWHHMQRNHYESDVSTEGLAWFIILGYHKVLLMLSFLMLSTMFLFCLLYIEE